MTYRLTATVLDHAGVRVDCTEPDVLGDYMYTRYLSLGAAAWAAVAAEVDAREALDDTVEVEPVKAERE